MAVRWENSGHILALDRHTTGDGIVAALQVLAALREAGGDLANLLGDLHPYPQKLINVPLSGNFPWKSDVAFRNGLTRIEARIAGRGRVLLRASGTEPLLRVMVEGEHRKEVPTLDTLAPGLWVGFMTLSLADFLGGPVYGKTTNVLWGVEMFSLRRHPVQIYELLAGLMALWLWWRLTQKKQSVGMAFLASAAAYSARRLFVDAYRDNTPLTADGYDIIQLITFAIMLVCLFLISRLPQTPSEEAVAR